MQDPLYQDPELAQFYDIENGWNDDSRYCLTLASVGHSVLDLGCGTGLLAAALSDRCEVYGVDPAAAMLDVARTRHGGSRVTWIEADARQVRLNRRFDLIVLTGHAFQVFLSDDDQRAVCATIAAHLKPDGRFIFDSRNPECGEWLEWTPERSHRLIHHPQLGQLEAWNVAAHDVATGIVTYGTFYRATDGRQWQASARIRFASCETIAARIAEAGLEVHHWLGDWTAKPFTPGAKEIIAVGGLA